VFNEELRVLVLRAVVGVGVDDQLRIPSARVKATALAPICSNVVGTSPELLETPALLNRITSRSRARPSVTVGSQFDGCTYSSQVLLDVSLRGEVEPFLRDSTSLVSCCFKPGRPAAPKAVAGRSG